MEKDRTAICEIISQMLDNPVDGIYPTTTAFDLLEHYVSCARHEGTPGPKEELVEMTKKYNEYFNLYDAVRVNIAGLENISCDALGIEPYQHNLYELIRLLIQKIPATDQISREQLDGMMNDKEAGEWVE
jgi:hypothetical protein